MRNQPDEYFAIAGGTVQRESCPELRRKTPNQIHGGITGNLSVLSLYCFQPAGVASNPLRICHTCQRVKLARTFAPRTHVRSNSLNRNELVDGRTPRNPWRCAASAN